MRLTIPKITRPVALTDFAPELKHDDGSAAVVHVWVNPPSALVKRHAELRDQARESLNALKTEKLDEAAQVAQLKTLAEVSAGLHAVFSELWSVHPDAATHWSAEDVAALANNDENPALFRWLIERTLELIGEYRKGIRKN